MYSKYMLLVTEFGADKPFMTVLEFSDGDEALARYYEYQEEEMYDVVLYRMVRSDYSNL